MGKQYLNFIVEVTRQLEEIGAIKTKIVERRYTEFDLNGMQILLPFYHQHNYIVFFGDCKVFHAKRHWLPFAIEDFTEFLKNLEC